MWGSLLGDPCVMASLYLQFQDVLVACHCVVRRVTLMPLTPWAFYSMCIPLRFAAATFMLRNSMCCARGGCCEQVKGEEEGEKCTV